MLCLLLCLFFDLQLCVCLCVCPLPDDPTTLPPSTTPPSHPIPPDPTALLGSHVSDPTVTGSRGTVPPHASPHSPTVSLFTPTSRRLHPVASLAATPLCHVENRRIPILSSLTEFCTFLSLRDSKHKVCVDNGFTHLCGDFTRRPGRFVSDMNSNSLHSERV